jgi:pantothenate kinase
MARPAKTLDEDQIAQVEGLASVLSVEQIADYFGMVKNTFYQIMERQPEVYERYKRGKAKAIGTVANGLLKQAREGNLTAAIFYLKTQAKWRETDRLELTGADGEAINVQKITREIIDPKHTDS